MWIKTLKLGYLNTDKIETIRVRPKDKQQVRHIDDPPDPDLHQVAAHTSDGMYYTLTEGVSKERAEWIIQEIVQNLSESPVPGTFQNPYHPPTE